MSGSMSVAATVWVPGWHCWPQAPAHRSYLRAKHRHLFGVTAEVSISSDHGVEFHDLEGIIAAWWAAQASGMEDRGSCESMCSRLARDLTGQGLAPVEVTVSEDGEAFARWRKEPDDV